MHRDHKQIVCCHCNVGYVQLELETILSANNVMHQYSFAQCPPIRHYRFARPLRNASQRRPSWAPLLNRRVVQLSLTNDSGADADERVTDADDDIEETFVMEEGLDAAAAPLTSALATPARADGRTAASDAVLVAAIIALAYGLVGTTMRLFSTAPVASLAIGTSLNVLPWYAAQSLTRMAAGYIISLIFALSYAYVAYRVDVLAQLMLLVIDVLQSVPLLSFLPGVVLGLIAIFPGQRIGVELAAVLLLFTSMAWNMLLGFYQSLRGIPRDLVEVAHAFRMSKWKRFWTLELPAGAIGLVWNSVISVAGGWFFLISIESFELGNKDFRLPGLGSFLAAAANMGDYKAILAGLAVVIAVIVIVDFLLWQPLIAWSSKYTFGGRSEEARAKSPVLLFLQRSVLVRAVHARILGPLWESFVNLGEGGVDTRRAASGLHEARDGMGKMGWKMLMNSSLIKLVKRIAENKQRAEILRYLSQALIAALAFGLVCVSAQHSVQMMKTIPFSTWISLGTASVLTFGRVFIALALSLLWTIPAGVAIGRNRDLSAKLQPVVQIAASVPATALFPFVLLFLAKLGGGLQIGSVALMMLGTMWYVLFNVIAGAQAIPAELFDVDSMYNKKGHWWRWRTLVLPGIFPYLITGIVTAVGGAWNASIVSEYVVFRGGVLKTHGLGSLISEAAASGNYPLLLAGTVAMSALVLLTNRLVWEPLYRLAENKYRI